MTPTLGADRLAGERSPARLVVEWGDVHVWHAALDTGDRLAMSELVLSADERQRAARFRVPRDRDRFVAARGLLRTLLGCYLARRPETLRFVLGPSGKPSLADEPVSGLRFNLSHAEDLTAIAVARGREVGVDLEWTGREVEIDRLIPSIFAPSERARLNALPAARKRAAFFDGWVRKEAAAKALGVGLVESFGEDDVGDGGCSAIIGCDDRGGRQVVTIQSLAVAPGFVGAVAAAGTEWHVVSRRWNG